MGLMWSSADDAVQISKYLRHTCEQDEGMAGYGWTTYDPRIGGHQVIHDVDNRIDLNMDFMKNGGGSGQAWGLSVKGSLRGGAQKSQRTTVVFYIGHEASQFELDCKLSTSSDIDASCHGLLDSKSFVLRVLPVVDSNSSNRSPVFTAIKSLQVPRDTLWQAKSIFLEQLKEQGQHQTILSGSEGSGNLQLIQMTFVGDYDLNILFTLASDKHSPESLNLEIHNAKETFQKLFETVYQPQGPFSTVEDYTAFSQSLLSNLMGGIGFFYGTSRVSTELSPEKESFTGADVAVEDRGPNELFSTVPSRPFFPRGFLWDEGFHLLVILDWDMDLTVEITKSWFKLMDDNGWIAREQILGPEAASKVPPKFQTQYQHYANPPTMFMVIEMLLDRMLGRVPYHGHPSKYMEGVTHSIDIRISAEARTFLETMHLKLRKHYFWFRRTQIGKLNKYQSVRPGMVDKDYTEGYRWRGRTPQHILTSGLDDYPRSPTLSDDELHLDALCWVGLMSRILTKLSSALRLSSDPDSYTISQHSAEVARTLDGIHWSDRDKAYCDTTITPAGKTEHICHKGYISLMPLLTGVLSDPFEPKLNAVLDLVEDPAHLWSAFGLRSLSTKDRYYGTDENYWRSPIWVNINYLVLIRLLELAEHRGPQQERCTRLYTELRKNIVNTVYQSWKDTGFAWEQYNPDTGKGQRTQHFTGWTALVVRIMAMPDLDGQEIGPWPKADKAIKNPSTASGPSLLLMLTGVFILGIVFRRKIMQTWRRLMDT